MSEPQNLWREKYRQALEQQEQLERTLAAQQAIFQRAISVLTSTAEGKDNALDQRLQALRASAKHSDVAGFDRMLKSLPRVTEEVEAREKENWQEMQKTLTTIATQIHKQSPDANIKAGISEFKKQLPKNPPIIQSTLKRLLQQLSNLQQLALDFSPKNSSGFFDRLFKEKKWARY